MSRYDLDDLVRLMAQLRDPEHGCPWDRKQTLASIVPHTLDEVYEVIDAIERDDRAHLRDELGDLLFQVVFYARICEEDGDFSLADVVDGLVRKLLRRHPHVYPDGSFASFGAPRKLSEAEIRASWERIKAEERAEKGEPEGAGPGSRLDDVPTSLPALLRAHKLQKRAAAVGFDWPEVAPVLRQLELELAELREAIAAQDSAAMADELGDLFFTCVNLARHLGQESEQVLRAANRKFERRFREVERLARERDIDLAASDEALLDQLWQEAKRRLQAEL